MIPGCIPQPLSAIQVGREIYLRTKGYGHRGLSYCGQIASSLLKFLS